MMAFIGCDAINMLTTCAAHGGPQWLTGMNASICVYVSLSAVRQLKCVNLSVYNNRCMYGLMDRSMDGWMDRWLDGWIDGWMDGFCMYIIIITIIIITIINTTTSPSFPSFPSSSSIA